MIPVKIQYKKKVYELVHPETLNELTPKQYLEYSRLLLMPDESIETRWGDQISLMLTFLGIGTIKHIYSKWYSIFVAIMENKLIDELVGLQSDLFKEQVFNNWILKTIKHNKHTYYGHDDCFGYMTFGEFIYADMLFMSYFNNPSDELLNKFIASLYKWEQQEDFSSKNVEVREKELNSLPGHIKHAVLFNYSTIRQWLQDEYPKVFGESEENKQEIILGNHSAGWLDIRRNLAGDLLNLDKIDKVSLHDALADLNEKIGKK